MSQINEQTADFQLADLSPVLKVADAANILLESLPVWLSTQTRKSAGRGRSADNTLQYGVQKLRELILELAVRGKLVPQDPNDEPAIGLVESIERDLNFITKINKSKKNKNLPEISPEEHPYELPQGWVFIRNGNLFKLRKGKKPKNLTEKMIGAPYLDIEALDRGNITRYTNDESCPKATSEDILVVCDGSRSGLVLNGMNGVIGSTLAVIQTPKWLQQFIKLIFSHGFSRWNTSMKGAAIPHLDTKSLIIEATALPPLAEQQRIVKKVDELMALCDQLERQQADAVQSHDILVNVLLDTLTQSENAEDFQQNWRRIAGHFDTLFTTEFSINQLKQTLLQLAVMGKLVPQDPSDEPAGVLLEKIAEEKARLVKEGKIKKQKPTPSVSKDELSIQLPQGWEQTRLQSLATEISTGPFGSMIHKSDYQTNGIPLINPSHMFEGKIREDETVAVSSEKAGELKSYSLNSGDIVMARRGEVGRCAIVSDREQDWLCGTGSFVLRFMPEVDRSYIYTLFMTFSVRNYLTGESVGTTMTNLNHGILNRLPIALPPANEQHRIVKKVDELMALCNQLKERLNQAQTMQKQLADAVISQAVE